MPHQAAKIIVIEGPLVDGKVIGEKDRGPLVSAPIPGKVDPNVPTAFRPRSLRFYNYAEDPALPGKAIGKGHGVYFKRTVRLDTFHRELIASGVVKAVGEPKDAPAPITRAMRLQALDAQKQLPGARDRIKPLAEAAAAADKAAKAEKGKDAKPEMKAAAETARRRALAAVREVEAYERILDELKQLEETR